MSLNGNSSLSPTAAGELLAFVIEVAPRDLLTAEATMLSVLNSIEATSFAGPMVVPEAYRWLIDQLAQVSGDYVPLPDMER